MTKSTLLLFAFSCCVVPLSGTAQNPVSPPAVAAPPVPPVPPAPPHPPRPEKRSESGVFLGVDTAPVPPALSDQLNLPTGFGLLVDYVVPGSPAAVAGVKPHDILKMLNDQNLANEEQLSVLVHSFQEGQTVNLVVLRKGQETKLTATLQKRPAHDGDGPAGRGPRWYRDGAAEDFDNDFHFDLDDTIGPDFNDRLKATLERNRARIEAATARAEEQTRRAMEIAREHSARATGSRLDYDDARVLLRDSTGRIEIRSAHGKRTLTLRDADGKKMFEGPIDTPEQRKAIPADVLPQVEALERDQVTTFPKSSDGNEE